jgi:hypothetical protein
MGLINEKAVDHRGQEVRAKLFTAYPGETSTVTQITSRATGVTLSATAGQITTDTTSLAAAAEATFTVTNTYVTAKTVPVVALASGAAATTNVFVTAVAAGSFDITVANMHASTAETGALVINFVLIDAN